ncbi:MAG: SDR family NAD(P)-dependent oxidoreductase [Polyangiaceae bacterium]
MATGGLRERYGRWAVIAGASEGLGAAFARLLAGRGCDLLLLARRAEVMSSLADEIRAAHGVEVRTLPIDLGDAGLGTALDEAIRGLEVGVAVYNAAYSFVGPLLDRPLADALRVVDVNCRGPLTFIHSVAPQMVARRRGALVLMSSLAGFQGGPSLATYAASKAFNIVLGESLWAELRPSGVDVVVSAAGAIRTPGYLRAARKQAPGLLDPEVVAARTLDALGRGPLVVPGHVNQIARFVLGRLLPRASAVRTMARSTRDLE